MRVLIRSVALILICAAPSACALLVAGGVGAAGGYVAHEEGYRVQSPVTHEDQQKKDDKKQAQDGSY
jgi:hypothetical protein